MIFFKHNINKIILIIIVFLILLVFYLHLSREKEYIKTFNDIITVKIYTNKNPDKLFSLIENEKNSDNLKKILNKNGIEKFIINNAGNITAGKHYNDGKYLVSIVKENKVEDIIMLEEESIYIYEENNMLIASINDTLEKAENDIDEYLVNENVFENKKIYVINDSKIISDKFQKYIK